MYKALLGGGALGRVEGQHGHQPVGEGRSYFSVPLVFFYQHVVKAPGLEFRDVT